MAEVTAETQERDLGEMVVALLRVIPVEQERLRDRLQRVLQTLPFWPRGERGFLARAVNDWVTEYTLNAPPDVYRFLAEISSDQARKQGDW